MSGFGPKVLLIDDSLDTLDLVEVFLYRDFDVVTAENGFEGFKRAQELLPDLVITDIMMPVGCASSTICGVRKRPPGYR